METGLLQLTPADYPEQLREIPQPPTQLYLRGSMPNANTRYLAVVGSRALSPYGKEACTALIKGLKGHPISIVSGLALGADAAAHEAALDADLHTIAVLGSGISDHAISPRTNLALAKRILDASGALVGENSPDHVPFPSDFPKRNRIVAGLAHAVLIIEAGERSGTLITARLAGEYNRDLMCIPHRTTDPGGYGANLFIRLGAALVTESNHILEVLGLNGTPKVRDELLTDMQASLLTLIDTPKPKDELIKASGFAPSDALTALISLEMKGLAEEKYGVWQRRRET
ncbi:MAG TPA: DNA-processing protein DprA [Candidatus Paceibacterota bacterium]|nr:DNA-processing protein DprA [Candidatus Paceibacterota bacterium]